jgi:hypothetical protein
MWATSTFRSATGLMTAALSGRSRVVAHSNVANLGKRAALQPSTKRSGTQACRRPSSWTATLCAVSRANDPSSPWVRGGIEHPACTVEKREPRFARGPSKRQQTQLSRNIVRRTLGWATDGAADQRQPRTTGAAVVCSRQRPKLLTTASAGRGLSGPALTCGGPGALATASPKP